MAINYPNFAQTPKWALDFPDIGKAMEQGQERAIKPREQAEELVGKMLGSRVKGIEAKYKDQLMRAQINQANAAAEKSRRGPAPVLNNYDKAIKGYEEFIKTHDPDSQDAKDYKNYVNRIAQGSKGGADKLPTNKVGQLLYLKEHPDLLPDMPNEESYVPSIQSGEQAPYQPTKKPDLNSMLLDALKTQGKGSKGYAPSNTVKDIEALRDAKAGFVPGKGRTETFETPEEQKSYVDQLENVNKLNEETTKAMNAKRQREILGLKKGEDFINSQGKVTTNLNDAIAKRRGLSNSEKKEHSGRLAFNVTYPFILKATAYYSGQGSMKRFNKDIANYNTDKKAQKRIQNYITASQLISQGIIKEDATLGGANTNQVYNRLAKSLNASDLPIKFEQLETQFRLPNSAKLNAGINFNTLLNKSLKAAENIPAFTTEYLNGTKKGSIYNEETGKVDTFDVPPDEWEAFTKAGGY